MAIAHLDVLRGGVGFGPVGRSRRLAGERRAFPPTIGSELPCALRDTRRNLSSAYTIYYVLKLNL